VSATHSAYAKPRLGVLKRISRVGAVRYSIGFGQNTGSYGSRVRTMIQVLPLFFVAPSFALVGWAIVVMASRIERQRQRRNIEKFGKTDAALPYRLQQTAEKLLRRL
jgi:hypothetical protein